MAGEEGQGEEQSGDLEEEGQGEGKGQVSPFILFLLVLRQHQQKQNDLDKLFVFCYFLLFLVLLLLMVVLVLRQAAKDHAKGDLAKASHAAFVDKQRIILARLPSARLSFCVWRYWRPMTEKEPWRPPRRTRKARCRSGIFLM